MKWFTNLAVVFLVFSFLIRPAPVSAAGGVPCNVPVTTVLDIENDLYPITTTISSISKELPVYAQFELEESGIVRAYVNWDVTEKANRGMLWFSRDAQGINMIGKAATITSNTRDSYVYLEAGTYYCFLQWADACYSLGMALQFQAANTDEKYNITSFEQSNVLQANGTSISGFLTDNSPNDYYVFQVDKTAMATFRYSFSETISGKSGAKGKVTVYDSNQSVTATDVEGVPGVVKEFSKLLQPGSYFVKMSDKLGRTALAVDLVPYQINLKPSEDDWVTDYVSVFVDTDIEWKDITVYKGDVPESDVNNNAAWSDNKKRVAFDRTSMTFDAEDSGVYSVRVLDTAGNAVMGKITIDCIDHDGPAVKGAADGKAYNKAVTITWKDSGIGTKGAKLNGKTVKSGVKVSEAGEYELVVTDKLDNETVVDFVVDKKPPAISGVSNGKTYTGTQKATFSDDLSGVDRIVYNGTEIVYKNGYTLGINAKGTNRITVYDKAGNKRTITVTNQ